MASSLNFTMLPLYLGLISAATVTATTSFSNHFAKTNPPQTATKTTRLHFYFHDIVSGKNPSAIPILGPKAAFGMVAIIDDPLTINTKPGSKVVGRAQGLYAMASQKEPALLMAVNFVFSYGKYNGSGVSVMGRNPVVEAVREMPVVGGSGVFRGARGYALANMVRYKPKTGDAVVRYNVTVIHG